MTLPIFFFSGVLFTYSFLVVLGVHCCVDFPLAVVHVVAACRPLVVVASLVEHGLQGAWASVVVAGRLSGCSF